jgi:uncharacterized protein YkwD
MLFNFRPIAKVAAMIGCTMGMLSSTGGAQTTITRPATPPAVTVMRSSRPVPGAALIIRHAPNTEQEQVQQPEQQLTAYSHGDPTNEEQFVLEMINRARANPTAEGLLLSTTNDPDITNSYTQFGTPSRAKVKADFATYPAQPPLAFNAKLISAARGHSQDMLDHNFQGHNGSNGSAFTDRLNSAGYTGWTGAGENVFCYGNSMFDIHASFNIDFGNDATLGHRQNIMNFTGSVFTEVGLGIIHGGSGLPDVGPILTTEDFADAGKTFILGVVYDDKNHNGFYDPGEGLAGVTIKASSGTYTAVTSTSGGYAIPFSGSGNVSVTASGGPLTTTVTHIIDFNAANVKVDFTPDKTGLPSIVTLVVPLADTTINLDSVRFTWNKVSGATVYRLQVATDSLFKKLLVSDSTLTDTSKAYRGLKDSGSYWWRAQAKNAKGWGDYSLIQSFGVSLPPNSVVYVSPLNAATVDTGYITFRWRPSANRVTGYWFMLSKTAAMTNPIVNDSAVFDTETYVFSHDLMQGQTYYWLVRAQNDIGWSTAGTPRSFVLSTASVTLSAASGAHSLMASPNPTSGETHIRFTLEASQSVSLKIFNTLGEEIETLVAGKLTPNNYDLTWNAKALPAGVYVYQLRSGDRVESGQIILTR